MVPGYPRITFIALFFLGLSLVSCSGRQAAQTGTAVIPSPAASEDVPAATAQGQATSSEPTQESNSTISPSETGTAPTAATRTLTPLPYDWKDAPITPVISPHVLQIYEEGPKQGRNPNAFSVIGDCQAVPVVFMGPYELGTFAPPSNEAELWNVITHFKGSFARWGMAVRGGFTAASILTPMQADPKDCKSGETPLTCEFRIQNPSFVFITLETWLDPKTVDRYDGYLRKIMDYVVSHGAVPILMTKADSSEMRNGTHVFNPIIIQVAHDYDVPVINFWRAAQYLDNGGIDRNREGFHLSQAGYDLKNTLALRALYQTWSYIQANIQGGSGSATSVPTATATIPTPAGPQVTLPPCDGGCVFYGTAGSQDGVVTYQGVSAYNYATTQVTKILGEGFNLQDVSEDGKRLLANRSSDLYEVSLSDGSARLVSSSFYSLGKQGAYWDSTDSKIISLDEKNPIQTGTGTAMNLYPSPLDGRVYFENGSCSSQDFCQPKGVFLQQNGQVNPVEGVLHPVFSPDGKGMAYLNPAAATSENWYHINYVLFENPQVGVGSRRIFYLPDKHKWLQYPDVREMAFSPNGQKLFILDDVYYEYTENSLRLEAYLVDLPTGILYDFGKLTGNFGSFKPRLVWSPKGDKVLFFLTSMDANNQYHLSLYQSDLGTGDRFTTYQPDLLVSSEYFYITNLYWR